MADPAALQAHAAAHPEEAVEGSHGPPHRRSLGGDDFFGSTWRWPPGRRGGPWWRDPRFLAPQGIDRVVRGPRVRHRSGVDLKGSPGAGGHPLRWTSRRRPPAPRGRGRCHAPDAGRHPGDPRHAADDRRRGRVTMRGRSRRPTWSRSSTWRPPPPPSRPGRRRRRRRPASGPGPGLLIALRRRPHPGWAEGPAPSTVAVVRECGPAEPGRCSAPGRGRALAGRPRLASPPWGRRRRRSGATATIAELRTESGGAGLSRRRRTHRPPGRDGPSPRAPRRRQKQRGGLRDPRREQGVGKPRLADEIATRAERKASPSLGPVPRRGWPPPYGQFVEASGLCRTPRSRQCARPR